MKGIFKLATVLLACLLYIVAKWYRRSRVMGTAIPEQWYRRSGVDETAVPA